jgi:transcriptional regulator with XRE-family HTH domain
VPDTANIYSVKQDNDTMGGRMQRARDASGLSVTEVAGRLGVKQSTVQAWENDRSQPRANKLQMVAGLLNISLAWLMDGLGRGPAEASDDLIESIETRLSRMRQLQGEFATIAEGLESDFRRLAAESRP